MGKGDAEGIRRDDDGGRGGLKMGSVCAQEKAAREWIAETKNGRREKK